MKIRKRVLLVVFIVILMGVCICTLPFPERVDISLSGAQYSEKMEYQGAATIEVSGYRLHYLLREDILNVMVQFDPELPKLRSNGVIYEPCSGYGFVTIPYYDSSINRYSGATFAFAKDFSEVVLLLNDQGSIFAAAMEPAADMNQVLQSFDFLSALLGL